MFHILKDGTCAKTKSLSHRKKILSGWEVVDSAFGHDSISSNLKERYNLNISMIQYFSFGVCKAGIGRKLRFHESWWAGPVQSHESDG